MTTSSQQPGSMTQQKRGGSHLAIDVVSDDEFIIRNTGVNVLYNVDIISNTMWLDGQTSIPVLDRDQTGTVHFFPFAGRFIKVSFYNGERFIVEEHEIPIVAAV